MRVNIMNNKFKSKFKLKDFLSLFNFFLSNKLKGVVTN